MKYTLLVFSMMVLRCCWGPTDFQLMLEQQKDTTLLKELNGTYHIDRLKGEDISSFKLDIDFNNNTQQVSGFSGCNRFFGPFSLKNNKLEFGALSSTQMHCNETENAIEKKLLKAFEKANLILFTDNGFSLYNKKKVLLSATKTMAPYESIIIDYTSSSRGSYQKIIVKKEGVSVSQKRGKVSPFKKHEASDWNKLLKNLQAIDLDTIPNLVAPSKDFQFDGAAISKLKIILNNKTFETPSFDHGNPPKAIASLVKDILSMAENMK
ncbi:META domain-containing protein [Tamlana sp. 2201CG12-4]|uniref:META domain-containing protein n=1 Tax=Tamlana sp. 2201CG12-4 TaxID=3112582 RepID=UPI002DB7665F|nr:META domain-containing protein [Tamlana sp. 2201CG12-4]MEC3906524.1 META domain-containing protein [Tamlana sp. 2201CG12-4]